MRQRGPPLYTHVGKNSPTCERHRAHAGEVREVQIHTVKWMFSLFDNYFQMPHTHFRKSVKQRRYPALLLNLCLQTRFAQAHHPAFSLLLSASQL